MMGRRTVLVCLIVICAILSFFCFGMDDHTELSFSRESGFYEEPFELELHAPKGAKIYYTLDGSEPDENAILYTGPITIKDATENDNMFSMRTDVSAGFLTEEIEAYGGSGPCYVVPDYNVDKSTVIRCAYCDVFGNFSETKTASYFVGYADKPGYDNLNIISITTEPANLFNYYSGIYVLGEKYDVYALEQERDMLWWLWRANYSQHGKEWERAANVMLFNREKELLLNQECGIRIQGGGSRGRLPRSINIYAREEYDGNGRFFVDLFDTGYMADTITLSAGGDDTQTKLRDMLTAELSKERNFAVMNFVPYAMFLNGEYWGVYWVTEKYDDAFLEYYYGVKTENVVMIKNGDLAEGRKSDYMLYAEMIAYMSDADLSIQGNYEYACQIVDIQSLIDYYATEIYIGRYSDWPASNFALWRSRETGKDRYGDGKWRWMLFDVNSAAAELSAYLIDHDTFSSTMKESELFNKLCKNEEFKRQFVISFMDIANTCFAKDNVDAVISNHISLMTEAMGVHNKRFFGNENYSQFYDAVADIQIFFDYRRPYIVQYLKENFGLSGTLVPVEIEINNPDAGRIILNTAELSFDKEMKWNGEYFTDYPIVLNAVANEGYRFVGWENDVFSGEASIEVGLDERGISLMALFEAID